jgi:hypothetical protein
MDAAIFLKKQLICLPALPITSPPAGGRPRLDKRKAIMGFFGFWINRAKWISLPSEFGTSNGHRAIHVGCIWALSRQLFADI